MKRIYIASYHQSEFGKLYFTQPPEILRLATLGACGKLGVEASALDVATVGAPCAISLNRQGLLAGLLADIPGLNGKPIETAENACATGGQAVLSVIQKLQLGLGEVGLAVGFEKMRDASGKVDGRLIGEALGYFSHPDERAGKVFVFPHIFAEIMLAYMEAHGVTEEDLARIAVQEYHNAHYNPFAQMRNVELSLEQAVTVEGVNRYIVDGLPLKTYDCSQISDGYAALILATEKGLDRLGLRRQDCVELVGYAQATDPLLRAGRDVLRPRGALASMQKAYAMAQVTPADIDVAEIHDCFTVMGALGAEVLGVADYGQGTAYWKDGLAALDGPCPLNTSGGLIAKGHPIGATGIAMIGWCYWQLLGQAPPELQVREPRLAATFNIGGPICASVCTVLHGPK